MDVVDRNMIAVQNGGAAAHAGAHVWADPIITGQVQPGIRHKGNIYHPGVQRSGPCYRRDFVFVDPELCFQPRNSRTSYPAVAPNRGPASNSTLLPGATGPK